MKAHKQLDLELWEHLITLNIGNYDDRLWEYLTYELIYTLKLKTVKYTVRDYSYFQAKRG